MCQKPKIKSLELFVDNTFHKTRPASYCDLMLCNSKLTITLNSKSVKIILFKHLICTEVWSTIQVLCYQRSGWVGSESQKHDDVILEWSLIQFPLPNWWVCLQTASEKHDDICRTRKFHILPQIFFT